MISIHALREEGDAGHGARHGGQPISIHALREEGDVPTSRPKRTARVFLSTPSARRATHPGCRSSFFSAISIHALREEGDSILCMCYSPGAYFYPRPPRGGRQVHEAMDKYIDEFLSTPSARRATHAVQLVAEVKRISIHALREEGDPTVSTDGAALGEFLSTPSARRATFSKYLWGCCVEFLSTPSARRATSCGRVTRWTLLNFYPRPPRGGRLRSLREHLPQRQFLSTPSARRATAKTETKSLFSNKLYNILHEFRRALIYNGSKSYPNHAK